MSTFEFKIYPIARDTRLGPKSTLKLATNTPLSELITESLNLVGVKGEVATRLYLLKDLFAQDRASCSVSRDFCENTAHSELIDQSNIDIELADLSNGFSINNINHVAIVYFHDKAVFDEVDSIRIRTAVRPGQPES